MPTASDYARRTAVNRPRAGARKLQVRPLKVRFSSKKFKKLIDQTVHHSAIEVRRRTFGPVPSLETSRSALGSESGLEAPPPALVPKPVLAPKSSPSSRLSVGKLEHDPDRKDAMNELKKSLEEFEKLHKEICLLCYGGRMEGGTSGNSQPDESSCLKRSFCCGRAGAPVEESYRRSAIVKRAGEEATESETEQPTANGVEETEEVKEELTSGSEKYSSGRSANPCKHPKCQCQVFLTQSPYVDADKKKKKKEGTPESRGPAAPKGPKLKAPPKREKTEEKGDKNPDKRGITGRANPICKTTYDVSDKTTDKRDEVKLNPKPKPKDVVKPKPKDVIVATKGETCISTEGKETSKEDDSKSTESKYKKKLSEMRTKVSNPKVCGKKVVRDKQCQGVLCRLIYCCFRFVLIFPHKTALRRASEFLGRSSPTSPKR